jgi:hypothetical protein
MQCGIGSVRTGQRRNERGKTTEDKTRRIKSNKGKTRVNETRRVRAGPDEWERAMTGQEKSGTGEAGMGGGEKARRVGTGSDQIRRGARDMRRGGGQRTTGESGPGETVRDRGRRCKPSGAGGGVIGRDGIE